MCVHALCHRLDADVASGSVGTRDENDILCLTLARPHDIGAPERSTQRMNRIFLTDDAFVHFLFNLLKSLSVIDLFCLRLFFRILFRQSVIFTDLFLHTFHVLAAETVFSGHLFQIFLLAVQDLFELMKGIVRRPEHAARYGRRRFAASLLCAVVKTGHGRVAAAQCAALAHDFAVEPLLFVVEITHTDSCDFSSFFCCFFSIAAISFSSDMPSLLSMASRVFISAARLLESYSDIEGIRRSRIAALI